METAEALELHDRLLETQPAGARHDTDICPICVDKASQKETPPSRIPPGSAGPDASLQHQSHTTPEGGTTQPMSDTAGTISNETHEALVSKAVSDATSTTDKALQDMTAKNAELTSEVAKLTTDLEAVRTEESRLNSELDKAQVELKSATDKASQLEADLAKEQGDRAKADLAAKRSEQVKNLGLFPDDKIAERAEKWADLDEAAWDDRVAEWTLLAPAKAGDAGKQTTDSASALSGTSEDLTKTGDEQSTDAASASTNPRRAALGLS